MLLRHFRAYNKPPAVVRAIWCAAFLFRAPHIGVANSCAVCGTCPSVDLLRQFLSVKRLSLVGSEDQLLSSGRQCNGDPRCLIDVVLGNALRAISFSTSNRDTHKGFICAA